MCKQTQACSNEKIGCVYIRNLFFFLLLFGTRSFSSSFVEVEARKLAVATDALGELDVLDHDGHTLGVDGAEVRVLKEANEVSLGRLLEGEDSRGLEAKVGLEVLDDLTDETLEGELTDEKLGGTLVATDLTESDGTGAVTVRLLDTTGGGGGLASSLGGELLAGGLATHGLACGLLCTGHLE